MSSAQDALVWLMIVKQDQLEDPDKHYDPQSLISLVDDHYEDLDKALRYYIDGTNS